MTLFGKDLGRLRGKVKQVRGDEGNSSAAEEPEQPTEKGTQPGPAVVTRDDILAARRLGVLQASLPQELQEHLDQMVEDGKSFVQVTEIAEAYARAYGLQTPETPPANGGIKRPTGRAASAAPTEEPRHPTTLTELRVLKERDRAAYDRLMHPDSAFDPTKLARR